MILDVLHRIANHRQSLSREEAHAVMTEVLGGQCSDAQIAALLVALHMKGETVEEIVGFAEAIRAAATPLELPGHSVLDASGTGRDALSIPAARAAIPAAPSTFPQPRPS
jgi:anthranilate phosphoribosyltransferase